MDYSSANGCADAGFEDPAQDLVLAAPIEDMKGPHENVDAAASELSRLSVSEAAFSSASALELPTECAASNHNGFAPSWICAICLEKIEMEETSQIKGCEHAYCVNCILRWASYKEDPWCPQCKLPFSSLYVCKTLDGRLSDYMLEESVCLLLRASWFKPLPFELEEVDDYQDEDDFDGEYYYTSTVRLGNRRWGDSGYVRGGRKEARPIGVRQVTAGEASASGSGKEKETVKETAGRRAKRAKKRELEELKLKSQQPQQQQHKLAGRSSK